MLLFVSGFTDICVRQGNLHYQYSVLIKKPCTHLLQACALSQAHTHQQFLFCCIFYHWADCLAAGGDQQGPGPNNRSAALLHLQSSQAATTSNAQPQAPSAIEQMANATEPFSALLNAEPPPFPGPMFAGLNAVVNPFCAAPGNGSPFSATAATGAASAAASTKAMQAAMGSVPTSGAPAITAISARPTSVADQLPLNSTAATTITAAPRAPSLANGFTSQPAKVSEKPCTDALLQADPERAAQAAPQTSNAALPTGPAGLSAQAAASRAAAPASSEAAAPTASRAAVPTASEVAAPTASRAAVPAASEAAATTASRAAVPTASEAAAPTASTAAETAAPMEVCTTVGTDATAVVPLAASREAPSVIPQPPEQLSMTAGMTSRNTSKHKWDAMTRPESAAPSAADSPAASAAPVVAAAAAAAAVSAPTSSVVAAANLAPVATIATGTTSSLPAPSVSVPPLQASVAGDVPAIAAGTGQHGAAASAQQTSAAAAAGLARHAAVHSIDQRTVTIPAQLPGLNQAPTASFQLGTMSLTLSLPMHAQLSTLLGRLPLPVPSVTLSENQSLSAPEVSQLQPRSQGLEAGKELAARLAAEFAQQHRSNQSLAAAGKIPPVSGINAAKALPASIAEAVKAYEAAQKSIDEKASEATAAAEKLIHEQALKAKHSVQGNGDTHAARMEAIRLRNLARHDLPQPIVLPNPPVQPIPTAVAAAQPLAVTQPAVTNQSDDPSPAAATPQGKSKSRKKRGRKSNPGPAGEGEAVPDLPGAPAEFVARGSGSRLRTDSPASASSHEHVRKSTHSPSSHQVCLSHPVGFQPCFCCSCPI